MRRRRTPHSRPSPEAPGVELDNENGSLVYSAEVTKADGTSVDVVIDAGNADVLAKDSDAGEADEKGEADGAEAPEAPGPPRRKQQ